MIAGEGKKLGLYGFGAAAHIIAQVAKWQGRSVFAFTRPGDVATQGFARSLGATWAGGSDEMPPEPLDAAIIFATVGDLVPLALKAVRKGGRVVCAGIHMSDIPSFPYQILWGERELLSVANLTRQDGMDFLRLAPKIGIITKTTSYPLNQANQALADLRAGRFEGAAVLVPGAPINLGAGRPDPLLLRHPKFEPMTVNAPFRLSYYPSGHPSAVSPVSPPRSD
jgi:propanol-preferring alcohol dehydrogenase